MPSAVSAMGLAMSEQLAELGAPALKVTVAVAVTEPPTVAVTVLTWAVLDASVVLYTPDALVVPVALPKVLLEPVLLNATDWLATGLLNASSTVTVSVVVLVPLAFTVFGLAVSVVVADAGGPATNVTVAGSESEPTVAVRFLVSALEDASFATNTPTPLVLPDDAGERVLLEPVLAMETA